MIRHADGPVLFSPTDLTEFVACDHLTQLSLAAALGERLRPFSRDAFAELIQRKGKEHEARYLAALRDQQLAEALATRWRGVADFLERVEKPSALGAWSYEVLDTKLARHPRPEHALQLCFYSQAVAEIQGLTPELAYVVLGTRERAAIRLANVSAYFRRVRRRL